MRARAFLLVCVSIASVVAPVGVAHSAPQRWTVCGEWRQVTTPGTYAYPRALAVVSPEEAWLAGYAGDVRGFPAVLHWTGTRWERESFPKPSGAVDEEVAAFAVASSDDVWAVGSWRGLSDTRPLVAHWNGARWRLVPLGMPTVRGGLDAIALGAGTHIVAVGSTGGTSAYGMAIGRTLVLRFDGERWHRLPSPSPGTASQFSDLVLVGATTWAVGSYDDSHGATRTLAARLADTRWKTFLGHRGSLQAVDATSAHLVWAVGPGKDVGPQRAFIVRWDGTLWTTVRRLPRGTALQDIVVASRTDAWAVGYRGGMYGHPRPLILRRHGSPWTLATPPDARGRFFAVDGTPHNLWALSWRDSATGGGPPPLDTFHRC